VIQPALKSGRVSAIWVKVADFVMNSGRSSTAIPVAAQAPQLSPDGRFYLDGDRWLPMPGVAAKPSPSRLAGVLVLVGAAMVVIASFLAWLEATAPFVGTISRSLIDLTTSDGPLLVVFGVLGGLLGLALVVRGPSFALGITAALFAFPTLGIVIYDYAQVAGRVANVTATGTSTFAVIANVGPGPYVAGLGILVWAIGAFLAIVAPHTPPVTAPAVPAPALLPALPPT
jgi:hypothetical protein